ncbi:hypothetical protein DDB_G0276351 [Dictyostelium discoideum AX4]|uniref:Uncharacterized protein n=1 Tax=Dictyostelium discoideum TaxID=44689 RepID=Q8SSN4_DICDI|nr:hypothetical protein DDB_G0276351 [Dictyostelium discoideum AX4]EAL69256.1 hypothetical protein DDB_G0276351 [Dictyostelium discoideum AX4]|eukprot:XP_643188.1 hypothetical protein DDB_G0276351 [Dictyostelium discoideum AX4]
MEAIKKEYDFFGYHTSNSFKIDIILKELSIENFNYHRVDIAAGEQLKEEFLKLNPNNKIPVIVDNSHQPPLVIFESATILEYLADKYPSGKLLPGLDKPHERYEVLKWLTFTVTSQGPNSGSLLFFKIHSPEKIPSVIERFQNEVERIYGVMNNQLKDRDYLAGNELSIADISAYGWGMYLKWGIMIDDWESKYPNFKRWIELVEKRESFQYAIKVADEGIKKWKESKKE